jgi:hypothetical protein
LLIRITSANVHSLELYTRELKGSTHQLGSGLIDQSQKMTVAAMQMADMKVWAQRS